MREYRAKVKFRGAFPIDMLRYDACFPAREADSYVIADSLSSLTRNTGTQEVEVIRYSKLANYAPFTEGRWHSFNCKVEEV